MIKVINFIQVEPIITTKIRHAMPEHKIFGLVSLKGLLLALKALEIICWDIQSPCLGRVPLRLKQGAN